MPGDSEATLPEGLIAIKLIPPAFDPRYVSRAALVDDVLQGYKGPSATTIVATPGPGKSVLMAELAGALAQRAVATCWPNLDADENRPPAFALYFVSAL